MDEVRRVSESVRPNYTFFVVDAMTGQDAVQTAEAFHQALQLDGIILTKVDGDARGGAALSVKQVVGKPIAFLSTGERVADFETFHPDRLASRILGMGDVLSLIEKAEREYDEDVAGQALERLQAGPLHPRRLPRPAPADEEDGSAHRRAVDDARPPEGDARRQGRRPRRRQDRGDHLLDDALERTDPTVLDGSRRLRIAHGSGTSTTEVNNLLRQFKEMQKMMRGFGPMAKLTGGGRSGKGRQVRQGQRKKVKGGRVTPSSRGLGPTR